MQPRHRGPVSEYEALYITVGDEAAVNHLMRVLGKSENAVLIAIKESRGDIDRVVHVLTTNHPRNLAYEG